MTECEEDTFLALVKADRVAQGSTNLLKWLAELVLRPESLTTLLYRVSSFLTMSKSGFVGRILGKVVFRFNVLQSGCYIDPMARIGGGLMLPHPTGIVIGAIKMGANCKIYQNVTLARHLNTTDAYHHNDKVLSVGDNVTVYSGAVVVGKLVIGKNVVVGANSVVLKDVPDSCHAVGVPARIL